MPFAAHLGFPPPLLGDHAVRLRACYEPGAWLALEKPAGIWARPDTGSGKVAPSMDEGIWKQLGRDLPSWNALEVESGFRPKTVFPMDLAVSGIGLWGLSDAWSERLRNVYGSGQGVFVFELFSSRNGEIDDVFEVDLPIAQHLQEPDRWLVSHSTGKKAQTRFERIHIWERAGVEHRRAETNFLRGHQIRLHATEAGVPILNDSVYAIDMLSPSLAELKKRRVAKRAEASLPIWAELNLHLVSFSCGDIGSIGFERPRPMQTLLRKLKEFGK